MIGFNAITALNQRFLDHNSVFYAFFFFFKQLPCQAEVPGPGMEPCSSRDNAETLTSSAMRKPPDFCFFLTAYNFFVKNFLSNFFFPNINNINSACPLLFGIHTSFFFFFFFFLATLLACRSSQGRDQIQATAVAIPYTLSISLPCSY